MIHNIIVLIVQSGVGVIELIEINVLQECIALEPHLLMSLVPHVLLHCVQVSVDFVRAPQAHVIRAHFHAKELHQTLQVAHVLVVRHEEAMLSGHVFALGHDCVAFVLTKQASGRFDGVRLVEHVRVGVAGHVLPVLLSSY